MLEVFHQYMQINVYVVDDHGADVTDYVLEFSGPDMYRSENEEPTVYFHREVLEHVHTNTKKFCLSLFICGPYRPDKRIL